MHHFRQRIRDAACADIVYRQYRIRLGQRAATINHFLRTALNFCIAALHRIKIEVFLIRACVHARRRAAAQPDQHARPAQLNQQCPRSGLFFKRVARGNVAHTPGDHDRLVIAAHFSCNLLLVGAKVAGEIWATEFIVERRTAYRAFEHDLQRRRNASWFAIGSRIGITLPRPNGTRYAQIGYREPRQPCLGFGATPSGTLVAYLTAGTCGRTRIRRNRRRMIVGFHFHQDMRIVFAKLILAIFRREKPLNPRAFNDRRVIRIRHHRAFGMLRVGGAYHAEKRNVFRFAIDHPIRVEYLVAAVL